MQLGACLSEKQDFLNNHLALVPITPNEERTMEIMDEMFSSVGAQVMDTNLYQMSDPDDFEFYWEKDQLALDAFIRAVIDIPFSFSIFQECEMVLMAENPILIVEEQDNENSLPPHPTNPVSERPTQLLLLMRSRTVGTKIENVPDFVCRTLFE